jgi:hypothetical protein
LNNKTESEMEQLKDFMLLFRMEMKADKRPTDVELMAIKRSWGDWIGGIAQQARLVSSHQLGFESRMIHPEGSPASRPMDPQGRSLSGNLVLKATNLEEACDMAQTCPVLRAGGNIEIRDVLTVY